MIEIKVKKLKETATIPRYAHEHDGCFDLHCAGAGRIPSKGAAVFTTGLAFEIPPGYVMLVFGRSGLAFREGLRLINCTAVIDSGYHDELQIGLHNDTGFAREIQRGDRIAQAMIIPRPKIQLLQVAEFSSGTRESPGFGGSGR